MEPLILVLAVVYVVTLAMSAWFSATETAVLTVDRVKLADRAASGDVKTRKLLKLLEDPAHLIMAIVVGDVANDMIASSVAAMLGYMLFGIEGAALMAGFTVIITLFFGESFPKTIGLYNAERWLTTFSKAVWFYAKIMEPISDGLAGLSKKLAASLGGKTSRERFDLKQRILELTDVATRLKVLDFKEGDVIRRILHLGERRARDVMTPKKHIAIVSSNSTIEEVAKIMAREKQSNLLVYDGSSDNVVGVVALRDILSPLAEGKGKESVKNYLTRCIHVLEDEDALDVLTNMQRNNVHVAIVHDQVTKNIKGIVVLRDFAEEVLGHFVC